MEIKIDYCIVINKSEDKILVTLNDFKSYPIWWPKKFKTKYFFKENKNLLIFSPAPTINITWEIKKSDNKINTIYSKGPLKGGGEFKTKSIDAKKTIVYYNITVSPRTELIKFIPSPIISVFKQIHIFHMKQLFKSLENYLN